MILWRPGNAVFDWYIAGTKALGRLKNGMVDMNISWLELTMC